MMGEPDLFSLSESRHLEAELLHFLRIFFAKFAISGFFCKTLQKELLNDEYQETTG